MATAAYDDTSQTLWTLSDIISHELKRQYMDLTPGLNGIPDEYTLVRVEAERVLSTLSIVFIMVCRPAYLSTTDTPQSTLHDRVLDYQVPLAMFHNLHAESDVVFRDMLRDLSYRMVATFYRSVPVRDTNIVASTNPYSRMPTSNVGFDNGPSPRREAPNRVANGLRRRITYRMEVRNERNEELDGNNVHNALRADRGFVDGEGGHVTGRNSRFRTTSRKVRIRK